MEEFANDNFKFDENGRKFSKWVENSVGKGEIAHYEQISPFSPTVFFKRPVLQTHKNQGLFGKGLNVYFPINKQEPSYIMAKLFSCNMLVLA